MLLKNFYFNTILRILGILANCIAIAFCLQWKPDWLYIINLVFVLILQVILLIVKINRVNKDLESFFSSMRSSDSSFIFSGKKNYAPFMNLYRLLEEINTDFQKLKIDNHIQNEYFKVLVEHVNIGIISFNSENEITLYNRAARDILRKRSLSYVEELDQIQTGLGEIAKELKPTEQKLISIYNQNEVLQLSVRAALIKRDNDWTKIVSFQNIKNELDEKELESWQKLIRVLTHELMNSAGPINSTISTIKEFLTNPNGDVKKIDSLSNHIVDDTVEGLKIIEERSLGMMEFVSKFRSLTLLPKPTFTTFQVSELLRTIELLMADKISCYQIVFETRTAPSDLKITADKGMMEQVLINLVSNSILAIGERGNKHIKVSASFDENKRPLIQVADNGVGIPLDIQDKIFIPFFTTRKDGSGIGLSLSSQLVRLQGGTLSFTSIQGEGTVFTIKL